MQAKPKSLQTELFKTAIYKDNEHAPCVFY